MVAEGLWSWKCEVNLTSNALSEDPRPDAQLLRWTGPRPANRGEHLQAGAHSGPGARTQVRSSSCHCLPWTPLLHLKCWAQVTASEAPTARTLSCCGPGAPSPAPHPLPRGVGGRDRGTRVQGHLVGLPGPSLPSSGPGEASGSLTGMETEPQPSVCVGAGRGWASGWAGPGSGLTRVYWSTVPAILASPLAPPDTQKPHPGGRWRQVEAARGTQTSGHARCPRWCYDPLAGPMVLRPWA